MAEILHHLRYMKPYKNGIDYQPQPVHNQLVAGRRNALHGFVGMVLHRRRMMGNS